MITERKGRGKKKHAWIHHVEELIVDDGFAERSNSSENVKIFTV